MGRTQATDEIATSLTSTGITLLGVLASIGLTVGFGVSAVWWIRVIAGVAAVVGLTIAIKVGTASRRGPLARLSSWIQNAP